MARTKLPAGPTELTAGWLTRALRETGVISDASVTGLDHEVIGQGVGVLGQLARFKLTYDNPEEGAPGSLVGGAVAPAGWPARAKAAAAAATTAAIGFQRVVMVSPRVTGWCV